MRQTGLLTKRTPRNKFACGNHTIVFKAPQIRFRGPRGRRLTAPLTLLLVFWQCTFLVTHSQAVEHQETFFTVALLKPLMEGRSNSSTRTEDDWGLDFDFQQVQRYDIYPRSSVSPSVESTQFSFRQVSDHSAECGADAKDEWSCTYMAWSLINSHCSPHLTQL